MSNFEICCCSTVDLSKEYLAKRNIHYVCFHFEIDGESRYDDLWQTLSPEELYKKMDEDCETKTSQVNVSEYVDFWEPMLKEGKDILHITLSSGLSGTYNSANVAKSDLLDKYPNRKICIVDSLAASAGYGLLVDKIADMRDEGKTLEDIYKWTEDNKLNINHWFFSSDLSYYIKGGRISKAAGFIGTIIGICPLLNVDYKGCLIPREKIRTKKKVMRRIVDMMVDNAKDGENYSGKCFLTHSACLEDAKNVANMIEEKFKKLTGKVQIFNVGATIGSHTGPGTVAVFFWGKQRYN